MYLYQRRESVAQLGTAALAILIIISTQTWQMRKEIYAQETPINLSIFVPSEDVQPPLEHTPPQKAAEQQPHEVIPESEMPAQVQEKVVEQATPDMPVKAVVAPAHVADPSAVLEAMYVAKVRGYLANVKRYPTGREASLQRPAGKTAIWFVLRRDGSLVEAGIETSSGSLLLDSTALSTVRRAAYTAFPEESWSGQAQHRFTVEMDFVPPSS